VRPAAEMHSKELEWSLAHVSLEDFVHDLFPGQLHSDYHEYKPAFVGAGDGDGGGLDCAAPDPSIYFNNPQTASDPLFLNEMATFPMAMEYANTSHVERPRGGKKQAVIGFAEMQWPYYHYGAWKDPHAPYLVISMSAFSYSERLNFQFVECSLLGWPGYSKFAGPKYPLRVVVKDPRHGLSCNGVDTGHARCNLETSWGFNPHLNSWRNTAKEAGALIELCSTKYRCDIVKVDVEGGEGRPLPQIFLFRVIPGRHPVTTTTRPSAFEAQDLGPKAVCNEGGRVEAPCGYCGPDWGDLEQCKSLCLKSVACRYLTFFSDRGCRLYSSCNTTWVQNYGAGTTVSSIYRRHR